MTDSQKLSMLRNTGLSYAGQAYALLVGLLILPFYLGHLGAEAYGLIGFFAVLQAWLQLLDAGLSPSLVRQLAFFVGVRVDPGGTHAPVHCCARSKFFSCPSLRPLYL